MQKAVLIICISLSKLSFAMQTLADGSGSLANNPSLNSSSNNSFPISSNSNSTYPSLGSRIENNLPSAQSTIDTLNTNAAGAAGGIIGERLGGPAMGSYCWSSHWSNSWIIGSWSN